jgi:hypothetical protein
MNEKQQIIVDVVMQNINTKLGQPINLFITIVSVHVHISY